MTMSETELNFDTLDKAIEAVDGTVKLTIDEWDDGFTWEIRVTRPKRNAGNKYEEFFYGFEGETPFDTATEAGIDACIHAAESLPT